MHPPPSLLNLNVMLFPYNIYGYFDTPLPLPRQLSIDLMRKGEARIGAKCQPVISQAGLSNNAAATVAAKSVVRETNYGGSGADAWTTDSWAAPVGWD